MRRTSEGLAKAFAMPMCAGPTTCRLDARCGVCNLFGNPSVEAPLAWADATPHRDLAPLLTRAGLAATRGRMAVNRLTGAGAGADLATLETTPDGLVYTGVVAGWLPRPGHDGRLPGAVLLLLASMRSTTTLGSGRSVGLGACAFEITSVALGPSAWTGEQALAQLERLGDAEDA